jgi:hypothetical protein
VGCWAWLCWRLARPWPNSNRRLAGYDARTLFNPSFIEQLATPTRTAGGQPGAAYWQNTADYKIDARLDEKTARVTATVDITYTNNSPDALPFVWLQLDQNLYRANSRGAAATPVGGGRFGNAARNFRGGDSLQTVTISLHGKKLKANYRVQDTRLQIILPEPMKPKGDKLGIRISYAFNIRSTAPTGSAASKLPTVKFLRWRSGTRAWPCTTMWKAGTRCPTYRPSFTWNTATSITP